MKDSAGPLVSVITPTLNQGAYIRQTLRSVQAQGYPRIEHIVVDGGSTDGTLEILRAEGDAGRIRWVSEPDRGMYDAVNKGLAMATGDILAYLNSDDAWFPWALEAVVERFAAVPAADVVFGDGLKVDMVTGAQRLRLFLPFDATAQANFESVMQPAVFWRRRVFERIGGFDDGLRYVADLDYWLRAAGAGLRIEHLAEVLAIERLHAERLSESQRERMGAEDLAMRTRHAGVDPTMGGRRLARRRFRWWQRRLWLQFLVASLGPSDRGPWRRFRRDGGIRVARARVVRGQLPSALKRDLANAVVSQTALDILGIPDAHDRAPILPST